MMLCVCTLDKRDERDHAVGRGDLCCIDGRIKSEPKIHRREQTEEPLTEEICVCGLSMLYSISPLSENGKPTVGGFAVAL